jgi:hypothetical protein
MIDCWAGKPPPLIICEARSTKGVLERIVREYLAPITATRRTVWRLHRQRHCIAAAMLLNITSA